MRRTSSTWTVARFGDLLKPNYGKALPADRRIAGGRYPVVGSAGIMTATDEALVSDPVVVIGRKGNVGQVQLLTDGCWPIDTTYYVRVPPTLDARYLAHYLRRLDLHRLDSSTATPSLRRQDLEEQLVCFPDLDEQRRIVEILEEHLSHLNAAESSLREGQQRASAMVSAARQRLVDRTGPTVAAATIGELAVVGTGTTPSRSHKRYYDGGAIPWITSGDLKSGEIDEARQSVTEAALVETSLRMYPPGTLLIAMYGEGKTRGTVAELRVPATINQACAAIQLHDAELVPWVRAVLDANYAAMRRLAAGGVQPNLNLRLVRGIEVPLPDADSRSSALGTLHSVIEAARIIQRDLEVARSRSSSLRRAVLVAAFGGKLTGRNTDAEVIEEMANV